MTITGSLQAVVMAGGKGSRMTDLTSGKPKCLLPVGNMPLVWYPLNMLQTNGFTEAIVLVPEAAKQEVNKIQERYNLSIKLEIVGIPGQEELGTADSLRLISDKLTGSHIVIVSGDLMLEESMRGMVDMHKMNNASFTAMLSKPMFDLKNIVVPGAKSTKYKKERDLIGLAGDQLCLFSAEADVEEEVKMSKKVLRSMSRMTIHSNLQDAHLYIMAKWVCDYIIHDKNISTIKGELLPILIKKQFSKVKQPADILDCDKVRKSILDFVPSTLSVNGGGPLYNCHAYLTGPCLRVNTVPVYWEANKKARAGHQARDNQAQVGERAQLTDCILGVNSSVSDRTTLNSVCLGAGSRVEEKVRLSNCVVMENVVIQSGSNIEDSIICDGCVISGKSCVKLSILGRGQKTEEGAEIISQLVLDKDRMMEV